MKNNDITFKHIEEFSEYVLKKIEKDNELFVNIIGKFDEIKATLMDVMLYEDINFESLHIESPDMTGYSDEYILSLWVNDSILEVGCEPLKKDGKYINPCGDITYLFGDCSSKIIPLCECSELYFVNFETEYDCDEDDDIYGFTVNNETDNGYSKFTYYSSIPVDKTDIHNILREFGF